MQVATGAVPGATVGNAKWKGCVGSLESHVPLWLMLCLPPPAAMAWHATHTPLPVVVPAVSSSLYIHPLPFSPVPHTSQESQGLADQQHHTSLSYPS